MPRFFSWIPPLFDWFLPPRCLKCQEVVEKPGLLCSLCWSSLQFISPPFCEKCGYPFEISIFSGSLCGGCLQQSPPFDKSRASLRYDEESKKLLLRFKHGDGTFMAPTFARWMYREAKDLLDQADLIIPVPLHWTRLMKRRYNQAALLGKELSKLSRVSYLPNGLRRAHRTSPQGQKTFTERFKNIKDAFSIAKSQAQLIAGKNILLIDDVITSGATVSECAKVLKKGGAACVYVLAVSRVVLPKR